MISLAELKVRAKINESNPFEVACWRAVERIYYQHERVWSSHDIVTGRHFRWLEAMKQARAAYEELQEAPTPERLNVVSALLDDIEQL